VADSQPPKLSNEHHALFQNLFEQMFQSAPWPDVATTLRLTQEQATDGLTTDIEIERRNECTHCAGRGSSAADDEPVPCEKCRGNGVTPSRDGTKSSKCSACGGLGNYIIDPCGMCEGHGKRAETATMKVVVPAGVASQTKLRLAGAGSRSANRNGDVMVHIVVGDESPISVRQAENVLGPAALPRALVHHRGGLPAPRRQNVLIYAAAIGLIALFIEFLRILRGVLP
jgi:DnaJ-class molecular chaperone